MKVTGLAAWGALPSRKELPSGGRIGNRKSVCVWGGGGAHPPGRGKGPGGARSVGWAKRGRNGRRAGGGPLGVSSALAGRTVGPRFRSRPSQGPPGLPSAWSRGWDGPVCHAPLASPRCYLGGCCPAVSRGGKREVVVAGCWVLGMCRTHSFPDQAAPAWPAFLLGRPGHYLPLSLWALPIVPSFHSGCLWPSLGSPLSLVPETLGWLP